MITRREYLKLCSAAGVAVALRPELLWASQGEQKVILREIPGKNEALPVVGLGSSASFSRLAGQGDTAAVREVLEALVQHGGTVFDTAPSYGAAEEMAGNIARDTGLNQKLFWASKERVAGFGGGKAEPAAARAQNERSIELLGKPNKDRDQVHKQGDAPSLLAHPIDDRDAGKLRSIGVTTTFPRQYEALDAIMRAEPLDFIGVDDAIDHRFMEERIFPLAQDKGIGVLAYQPFGRTRLWQKVEGKSLPDWAAEFDIAT